MVCLTQCPLLSLKPAWPLVEEGLLRQEAMTIALSKSQSNYLSRVLYH
jgi:hypothetical protein